MNSSVLGQRIKKKRAMYLFSERNKERRTLSEVNSFGSSQSLWKDGGGGGLAGYITIT
jgi:hypothetical protein